MGGRKGGRFDRGGTKQGCWGLGECGGGAGRGGGRDRLATRTGGGGVGRGSRRRRSVGPRSRHLRRRDEQGGGGEGGGWRGINAQKGGHRPGGRRRGGAGAGGVAPGPGLLAQRFLKPLALGIADTPAAALGASDKSSQRGGLVQPSDAAEAPAKSTRAHGGACERPCEKHQRLSERPCEYLQARRRAAGPRACGPGSGGGGGGCMSVRRCVRGVVATRLT